jgi:hypothetical protein
MKKKIFIGISMSLFAVATVFNMSISEQGSAGDVSLDAIAVMAQAQYENSHSGSQEVEMKVKEEVYKKWDAHAKLWIFSSVGGEGWRKVTKEYSYKCCMDGGDGCGYNPC